MLDYFIVMYHKIVLAIKVCFCNCLKKKPRLLTDYINSIIYSIENGVTKEFFVILLYITPMFFIPVDVFSKSPYCSRLSRIS